MITHLEPHILECEVKSPLGSIIMNKASGGDGIPVELLQSSRMMLWKCCTQYASKFGKLNSGQRTGKCVFIPVPKKGNAKEYSNYHTIALISHECSKFSNPDFNSTWTMNFQMFKLVLEKAEEPEIKLPTSAGSSKKQESYRKTSISALLTMPKPLTCVDHKNCGKFFNRWEYQTTWPVSWEICMQVRKQELELDMEQQTGSK